MANSAYIGIDASKGYADLIVLHSNKEVAEEPFRLYDAADGHRQLVKSLMVG